MKTKPLCPLCPLWWRFLRVLAPRSPGAAARTAAPHSTVRHAFDVVSMVTMFDEEAARSRSHGLRPEVVAAQADRLGCAQFIGRCTWTPTTRGVQR